MHEIEKVIKELYKIARFVTEKLVYKDAKDFLQTIDETIILLNTQQEQIDKLIVENASNTEMAEGLAALLKEQEVKTGKWIEQIDYMGDTYYDCSVCNESWTTIEGTPWVNGMNYCPHCGAKMEWEGR